MFDDLQSNPWFNLGSGILAESKRGVPTGSAIGSGILLGMSNLRRQQDLENNAAQTRAIINQRNFQMEQARAEAERQEQAHALAQATRERAENWAAQQTGPMGQLAAVDPMAAYQTALKAQMTPRKPSSDIGKLNQALENNEITRQQYDALVRKELQPSTSHLRTDIDPFGNVVQSNLLTGQVEWIAPGGTDRRTVQMGGVPSPRISGTQSVEPQETAQSAEAQTDIPVQERLSPFEQQEWSRVFETLPSESQNKYTSANVAMSKIPGIISEVNKNPDAFGLVVGGASLFPERMQEGVIPKAYEEYQSKNLSPAQRAARGAVFREASAIINDLAGAAVSGQEQKRIEKFAPKETDNVSQIITKLQGALREANTWMQTLESQFGLPERSRAQVSGGDGSEWETLPDGTQIRVIE